VSLIVLIASRASVRQLRGCPCGFLSTGLSSLIFRQSPHGIKEHKEIVIRQRLSRAHTLTGEQGLTGLNAYTAATVEGKIRRTWNFTHNFIQHTYSYQGQPRHRCHAVTMARRALSLHLKRYASWRLGGAWTHHPRVYILIHSEWAF